MSDKSGSGPSPTKAASGVPLPPLSPNHLEHPGAWATGDEPATAKQKGFIQSLESQKGIEDKDKVDVERIGKSDASIAIDRLKKGKAGNVGSDEEKQASVADRQASTEDKDEAAVENESGNDQSSPAAPGKRKHVATSPEAKRARAQAIKSALDEDDEEPEPEVKKARTDQELVTDIKAHDGAPLPPLSPEHLDHPDQWATGNDPATGKQKAFIRSLEAQKGAEHVEVQGKSEASERIEQLKDQ